MNFINRLKESFKTHSSKHALCINDTFYTYQDLSDAINRIRLYIQKNINPEEKLFGLVANDDLETYASIFALWFENKGHIPINPTAPLDRNLKIFDQTDINTVLDSSKASDFSDSFEVFCTTNSDSGIDINDLKSPDFSENNIAYILFTSGSTGDPKGIPISFKNLNALLSALDKDDEYKLHHSDKCLQMYDLTFDASLTAFMPAFLSGACSYTIPGNSMKYLQVFKLLNKYELTVIKMVPAIINYLRPYFSEINAESVRYCVFGGGKLNDDIVKEWLKCIPNSKLYNHYGPTECTVCSTYYNYNINGSNKSHNGVLPIGKPLNGIEYIIINESGETVASGVQGELCLSGDQLTTGYWKNDKLNDKLFFNHTTSNGSVKRFYKTGDVCYLNEDGDLMYVERKDFQVKIRGFRVELGEIEYHIRNVINNNISVVDIDIENGNNEIALVIEGEKTDTTNLFEHLQNNLPNYMVPTKTFFLPGLPHNSNGKLDRKQLKKIIEKK
ncbi:AMP-binding protein [Flavivirga eckloniae]|uniref:AMP-dependent synthetase n=1 Tax=Flavivirga eckloniae TaxID=1803846 RepID=A0A2K9PJL6_9FLAO|nr:AMP-binding protein [Flavivirga eckloniae]AUP77249.1 AMP-dependent synthetase [Flavivirga eckloniae]